MMQTHTFRYFFIPYLLFLILGFAHVSVGEHGEFVLWLNKNHNSFLDYFFRIWTYGGDEIVYSIIAICLLIWRRKFGYVFLLVGLVEGLISLTMKQFFFSDTPRPRKFFEGREVLNFVEGVKIRDFNSFPSGHTMTAFAIATFLALMMGKKEWSVALLFGALFVGISRMYLNQHFLIDVTVGSFIGVIVAVICYKVFEKYLKPSVSAS
ncbi:MAG: phosphatase PAP2 family protein [Cyclobacteriaceae bacterium]